MNAAMLLVSSILSLLFLIGGVSADCTALAPLYAPGTTALPSRVASGSMAFHEQNLIVVPFIINATTTLNGISVFPARINNGTLSIVSALYSVDVNNMMTRIVQSAVLIVSNFSRYNNDDAFIPLTMALSPVAVGPSNYSVVYWFTWTPAGSQTNFFQVTSSSMPTMTQITSEYYAVNGQLPQSINVSTYQTLPVFAPNAVAALQTTASSCSPSSSTAAYYYATSSSTGNSASNTYVMRTTGSILAVAVLMIVIMQLIM